MFFLGVTGSILRILFLLPIPEFPRVPLSSVVYLLLMLQMGGVTWTVHLVVPRLLAILVPGANAMARAVSPAPSPPLHSAPVHVTIVSPAPSPAPAPAPSHARTSDDSAEAVPSPSARRADSQKRRSTPVRVVRVRPSSIHSLEPPPPLPPPPIATASAASPASTSAAASTLQPSLPMGSATATSPSPPSATLTGATTTPASSSPPSAHSPAIAVTGATPAAPAVAAAPVPAAGVAGAVSAVLAAPAVSVAPSNDRVLLAEALLALDKRGVCMPPTRLPFFGCANGLGVCVSCVCCAYVRRRRNARGCGGAIVLCAVAPASGEHRTGRQTSAVCRGSNCVVGGLVRRRAFTVITPPSPGSLPPSHPCRCCITWEVGGSAQAAVQTLRALRMRPAPPKAGRTCVAAASFPAPPAGLSRPQSRC